MNIPRILFRFNIDYLTIQLIQTFLVSINLKWRKLPVSQDAKDSGKNYQIDYLQKHSYLSNAIRLSLIRQLSVLLQQISQMIIRTL